METAYPYDITEDYIKINKNTVCVKTIIFNDLFNDPIDEYYIDKFKEVTRILFGCGFNKKVDNLPSNIKILAFCEEFNQPLNNLPKGLKFLQINSNFKQSLDRLPIKLEELIIDSDHIKGLDNLPKNLQKLYLYCNYNNSLDNLPRNLKKLRLSYNFNLPINNLPDSLEEIIFDRDFNQKVDNLPSSLKKIKFGRNFNQEIKNLPENLEVIHFSDNFNQSLEFLPKKVTKIIVKDNKVIDYSTLSENVKELNIFFCIGLSINSLKYINILFLDCDYSMPLDNLPITLEQLYINFDYDYPLDFLPANLKILCLKNTKYSLFNLPSSLELLAVGYWRDRKKMILEKIWSKIIDKEINAPFNLKYLFIGENYKYYRKFKEKYPNVEVMSNTKVMISIFMDKIRKKSVN